MKFTPEQVFKLEAKYHSQVFGRFPVALVKGKGPYVWDASGKKYLDFFAGIAVVSLGHCHPKVVSALKKQAETLWHVSNWYYTQPQAELAELLCKLTGMEKVFFTNDGTESTECAIKLARKASGKKEIIAFKNSFHGRTMGALSLTWAEKYRKPFEPLVPGMKFVDYNNLSALEQALTSETAAVIVGPIQGEAGVLVPDPGYLKGVRELTEKKGVLMIMDECQTGFGRTGDMFAFKGEGIMPDMICLAKALGNGFPIGATLFRGFDFERGQHGGTFLGGPLACAVAKATVETIVKEKLHLNARKQGAYLMKEVSGLGLKCRGKGLMVGLETTDGRKTIEKLIKEGVLTVPSGNTVRLLPPLNIGRKHVDEFINHLAKII
ncbi:MAG: aspartate aminotransferase family protein [Candidatus Altiarchaeota archaeon]|nr:aspartate aminotransferase family protein [Candidatus Altiarchaeota archaeon]